LVAKLVQHHMVQVAPHACAVPVVQPPTELARWNRANVASVHHCGFWDVCMARVWVPLAAFKQGDLPPVCAKTGRPAQRWLVVRASTLSSWVAVPLLLLGIVPLLVAMTVAPRVEGMVPLSVGADNRLRRARIARWGLLTLTGALVVAWWLGMVLPAAQLVVVPLVMAVVLYGVEVAWSVGARLDHALDGVMLSGVHPGFRSAVASADTTTGEAVADR
jgi:hypothetical protein